MMRPVDYFGPVLGTGLAVLAASPTGPGGLLKEDVDQLVIDLAIQRDMLLLGHYSQAAVFDENGDFLKVVSTITSKQYREQQLGHPEWATFGIWGGAPLDAVMPEAPGDDAVELATAIDGLLSRIKGSETADAAPSGTPAITRNVVAPIVVAIIVVGLAASIIGATYVYRRFTPELQRDLAAIEASVAAYRARLAIWQATGHMAPPGPIEAATASMVKAAAGERSKSQLLWGLGLALGSAVAVVMVPVASNYMKKSR